MSSSSTEAGTYWIWLCHRTTQQVLGTSLWIPLEGLQQESLSAEIFEIFCSRIILSVRPSQWSYHHGPWIPWLRWNTKCWCWGRWAGDWNHTCREQNVNEAAIILYGTAVLQSMKKTSSMTKISHTKLAFVKRIKTLMKGYTQGRANRGALEALLLCAI